MLWFEGSVAEAVNLSKQRNAIFVVFVEGDNDLSSEMARTLEDGDITRRLVEQTNFLTIKLKSGSTDYVHFAQIYQFVPVPSLFFIGRNGTPLEVVCAGIQASSLATRIDRILEEHHKQSPSVSSVAVASGSKDNVKQTTADLIKSEASTSEASSSVPAPSTAAAAPTPSPSGDPKPQYEVVCDGDVCVRRPLDRDEAGPSQPANPPPNLTPVLQPSTESIGLVNQQEQAKMERAKQLIEARKREKAELEKQQEIQKELERRQVGQGVAELKKWQQDQEMKQIQEERRREKKENDMARQRVLDQIAQDRAERRARDPPPAPTPAPATPATPTAPLDVGTKARIQFKMPDGSSATAQFEAGDTLATVRRHVADNLHLTSSSFTLWTAFPRLELRDDSATLAQLKLAPSAALLVLPSSAVAKPNTSSRIASFTSFLIQILTSLVIEPTTLVYNWVRARLFPPPPANPRRPTPPPATSAPGLRYRHRSNVHRLNGDGEDDDNNTWNGNSTQQM